MTRHDVGGHGAPAGSCFALELANIFRPSPSTLVILRSWLCASPHPRFWRRRMASAGCAQCWSFPHPYTGASSVSPPSSLDPALCGLWHRDLILLEPHKQNRLLRLTPTVRHFKIASGGFDPGQTRHGAFGCRFVLEQFYLVPDPACPSGPNCAPAIGRRLASVLSTSRRTAPYCGRR
jgi:hypothetical protein